MKGSASMLRVLAGRNALVTGSSRGIGAGIARMLAQRGARVIVNHSASAEEAHSLIEQICSSGGEAIERCFDVSNRESVSNNIADIIKQFGPIDILVNNAGILRDRTFRKMTAQEWSDVLNVNLNGIAHTCAAVVPAMFDKEFGRIINISSFVAQTGNFGQTNYAAAKAGMIGFSRSLALEVATKNITVNCICPGFIDTGMWRSIPEDVREGIVQRIPMHRVGTVDEIAQAVRFLVEDADYITGQTLNVNGGIFIG